MNTGLRIPKELLTEASGIEKRIIDADAASKRIVFDEINEIWYHEALQYVFKKWNEGTKMLPPFSDKPEGSFAARVMSRLDDQIAVGNLEMKWKRNYR